jgi:flagellar hook assembly protein FlgD
MPGVYQFEWDGLDKSGQPVSSGIYYYVLKVGTQTQTRKMLLLR